MNDAVAGYPPWSIRIVIAGLSGSGKTTLAAILLHHLEQADDYGARFILDGESNLAVQRLVLAVRSGEWPPSNAQAPLHLYGEVCVQADSVCKFELVEIDESHELAPPGERCEDIVLTAVDMADFVGVDASRRLEREAALRRVMQEAAKFCGSSTLVFTKIGLYVDPSVATEDDWARLWNDLPAAIRQQRDQNGCSAVDVAAVTQVSIGRDRKPTRLPLPEGYGLGSWELRNTIMTYLANLQRMADARPQDAEFALPVAAQSSWQCVLTRRLLPAIVLGALMTLISRGCRGNRKPNPVIVSARHYDERGIFSDSVHGVCQVKNTGAAGNVTVTVSLVIGNQVLETQRRQLFLNAEEGREISVEFTKLPNSSVSHRISANAVSSQ